MNTRGAFATFVLASLCVLPAIASAAIVQKWQTAAGVNYRVIAKVGDINGDGVYKILTGETVSGTERVGIRSGTTGALLAQTVGSSYRVNMLWIMDIDANSVPEILAYDASGNVNCFEYTTGSSTLALRWSAVAGFAADIAWVDFDGNGHLFLVTKDPNSNAYHVYDNNGAPVAAPALTGPTGIGWTSQMYVDNFDQDIQQELVFGYSLQGAAPSELQMLQTSTAVGVEPVTSVSHSIELGECAPNPMFSMSRIGYSVPSPGPVALRLFDLAGREVRTLVDAQVTAGSHQATWDGRDANGRRAPAGTYFYQLNAAGQHASKRVVRLP